MCFVNIFGQKKNNIIWPKPSPAALKKMENTKVKTKKEKKNTNINNIPNISLLDNIETNDFDIFELDKKTPNTLFLIASFGLSSMSGTCLCAAAWYTRFGLNLSNISSSLL